jgi:hypothetical protein
MCMRICILSRRGDRHEEAAYANFRLIAAGACHRWRRTSSFTNRRALGPHGKAPDRSTLKKATQRFRHHTGDEPTDRHKRQSKSRICDLSALVSRPDPISGNRAHSLYGLECD